MMKHPFMQLMNNISTKNFTIYFYSSTLYNKSSINPFVSISTAQRKHFLLLRGKINLRRLCPHNKLYCKKCGIN